MKPPFAVVALAALLALPAACHRGAPPSAARPTITAASASTSRPEPLPIAPWLEPPLGNRRDWRDPEVAFGDRAQGYRGLPVRYPAPRGLLAVNERLAIFEGLFVLHARHGLSGPYPGPPLQRAVFAFGEVVYVATRDGELHRAHADARVGMGAFEHVADLRVASRWAAGSRRIAASGDTRVFVSDDGGVTFQTHEPRPDDDVTALFVRHDDVIVVQTSAGASASRDGGKSWSSPTPVTSLERVGEWIFALDNSCAGAPEWAVLSADGRTWVREAPRRDDELAQPRRGLTRALEFSPTLVAHASLPSETPLEPAPPSATRPRYAGYPLCNPIHSGRRPKTVRMIAAGVDLAPLPDCTGAECLRGSRTVPPPPTRTEAYLYHDGLCDPRDAVDERCRDGAPLTRSPHAALLSVAASGAVNSERSVGLPVGCHPSFVTFASGLALLACRAGAGRSIYATDADGVWASESSLAIDEAFGPRDLEMALDGTAMLAVYPSAGPSRAWVRVPVAIGAPGAWREITRASAVDYVLSTRGEALVITSERGAAKDTISIELDSPGRSPRVVLAHVPLDGDLWCVGRNGEDIVGLLRTARGTFERVVFEHDAIRYVVTGLSGSDRADPLGRCGF